MDANKKQKTIKKRFIGYARARKKKYESGGRNSCENNKNTNNGTLKN